jgi:glutamine synthetase
MDYKLKTKNKSEKIVNILEEVEDKNVIFARLQFIDILGHPKNIVIPANRLEEAFDDGIAFDGSSIEGYATIEESDKIALPDPNNYAILPEFIEINKTIKLNCDIYEPNGKRYTGDTKFVLEKVVKKVKDLGYIFYTGPECEFFLFERNGRESTLIPNDSAGYFDLSHMDIAQGVRADISLTLEELGIATYTSHHEVSKGQHEINFCYADALTTADRVITLKYITKLIAMKHNLYASFMPKPIFGENGSGMHTHLSLFNLNDKNAFYDINGENQLSDIAKFFIAGLLKHIKEICAILNPTVNSYKRLVPGYEAPTYISWANSNRSALIRIPSKRGQSTRCELRNPDMSGNPYLQFAVILASGLNGIENKIYPPEAIEKNIYELSKEEKIKHEIDNLPESLGHALAIMSDSELVKETLGEHIFNNFVHVKHEEWDKYRTQITKWEIEKYLPTL